MPILKYHSVSLQYLHKQVAFYTSEPLKAYYGTPLPSVIFFDRHKKKIWVLFRPTGQRINQWRKSVSVCRYVCLSRLIIPIFVLVNLLDHHQIWQICSLVHNLEAIFFEILIFIDFIGFVFLELSQFLRWNTDHVQIKFLWVLWGK